LHERWALARIYTKGRIKQLMEDSGFEVLEMHYVMAPMDVVKWRPLQQFLRNKPAMQEKYRGIGGFGGVSPV
jgi:hypothetical protein